jgi:hypothetical protein
MRDMTDFDRMDRERGTLGGPLAACHGYHALLGALE